MAGGKQDHAHKNRDRLSRRCKGAGKSERTRSKSTAQDPNMQWIPLPGQTRAFACQVQAQILQALVSPASPDESNKSIQFASAIDFSRCY